MSMARPLRGSIASGGPVAARALRRAERGPAGRLVFDLASPTGVTGRPLRRGRPLVDAGAAPCRRGPLRAALPALGRRASCGPGGTTLPLAPRGGEVTVPLEAADAVHAVAHAAHRRRALQSPAGRDRRRPWRARCRLDLGGGGRQEKDAALAIASAIRDGLRRIRPRPRRDDPRRRSLHRARRTARDRPPAEGRPVHLGPCRQRAEPAGPRRDHLHAVRSRVGPRRPKLAARENKADIINGVDLGGENSDVCSILVDLTRRETMNVSARSPSCSSARCRR